MRTKIFIKQITSLSVAAFIIISTAGCSYKGPIAPDIKDTKEERAVKKKIESIKRKTNHTKPIERIYVDNFIYKQDSLNHNIPHIRLNIDFSNGMTLKEFSKRIGLPAIVEDSIAQRNICFNGALKGFAKNVLNTVASLTETYWTYENGVIKFTRTKNIIYSFPFFSMERLQSIFNTGSNSSDPITMSVKEDIFDELEKGLKVSLDEVSFSGNVNEQWNETIGFKDTKKEVSTRKKTNDKTYNQSNLDTENTNFLEEFTDSKTKQGSNIKSQSSKNESGSKLVESKKKKGKKGNGVSMSIKPTLSDSTNKNLQKTETNRYQDQSQKTDSKRKDKNYSTKNIANNTNTRLNQKDKTIANQLERVKVRNLNFTTNYGVTQSKIALSKEMGTVFAKLTPSEEKRASSIIKRIIKKHFSNLVVVDTYILSVNSEKVKDYSLEFGAMIQNGFIQSAISLTNGELNIKRDSLSLAMEDPNVVPHSGSIVSGIINFFIGNSSGQILSEPKIVTMPNIPARIKDTRYYPYIEPKEITGAAGNTVSYTLKNVEEGIDLTVLPTVLSDNTVFLSIGLGINQYLGDKTINAGVAGTFNLPQQAPKKLNTTFRIKPGDIIILGGIKSIGTTYNIGSQAYVPTADQKAKRSQEFIIVAMPRLIKFVEEKNRAKEENIEKREKERYKKLIKNQKKFYRNLNIHKVSK